MAWWKVGLSTKAGKATAVGFMAYHCFVAYEMTKAHPTSMWGWAWLSFVLGPYQAISKSWEADATRLSDMLLADAQTGVLSSLDSEQHTHSTLVQQDESTPRGKHKVKEDVQELKAWITQTLAHRDDGRNAALCGALVGEDLLLDNLRGCATLPDSLKVLMDLIDVNGSVQVSLGDKLKLTKTLMLPEDEWAALRARRFEAARGGEEQGNDAGKAKIGWRPLGKASKVTA